MRPGDLDTGDPLVTAEEAADRAGVAVRTLHAYAVRGHAPRPDGYVGRTPVWREPTIATWLADRDAAPAPGPDDRLDLRDAAELAGIGYRQVLELVDAGTLAAANNGESVTVRRGDVLALQA